VDAQEETEQIEQGTKMPDLQKVPFAISSGGSYSDRNNNSELLNLYVHMEEQGSKSNHILINTSGLELLGEVDYTIFGVYEFLNKIYVATEQALFVYHSDSQTFDNLGTVSFDRKVTFADNGIDLMIVGNTGYAYTPSTGSIKNMALKEGWYPAAMVTYMDGYFIFNRTSTGQFFISKLYSTEIDPIDWASAESAPDDTIGVIVASRQLWIMGERTAEVWYDSGDPDFPFTRISGAVSDIGCSNHQTIAKIRDNILFAGTDNKVYLTNGYTPSPISTAAIEKHLSDADRTTLIAFTYTENGHWFYVLSIDNDKTFVYDLNTAQWHTRASGNEGRWTISGAINLYESGNIVGYSGKKFHAISIDNLTENGERIRREAVSLPVNNTVNRIRIHEVQLDIEVAYDDEATVILQLSKDSGATWSNNNLAYTGKVGERSTRVRWQRLGQTRDAIFRIVITDAIPIRIIGLWARTS